MEDIKEITLDVLAGLKRLVFVTLAVAGFLSVVALILVTIFVLVEMLLKFPVFTCVAMILIVAWELGRNQRNWGD